MALINPLEVKGHLINQIAPDKNDCKNIVDKILTDFSALTNSYPKLFREHAIGKPVTFDYKFK